MGIEEEHEAMHRRGELIKFGVLVVVLLVTILVVALARPLIFGNIVPAVLGWEAPAGTGTGGEPGTDAPAATEEEQEGDATAPAATPVPADEAGGGAPAATAAPEAYPGATDTPAGERTHTVQQGETLSAIAVQYGVTVEAISDANDIGDPDRILPGDVLIIPSQ